MPWLLLGDDLRGFPGGSKPGQRESRHALALGLTIFQVPARRAAAGVCAADNREGVMNRIQPKPVRLRLEADAYEELRQRVLRRDAWRCQWCGSRCNLEVHHKEFRSHS